MTDVFKILVKYRRKIIAKYRHLSPSGNRALAPFIRKIYALSVGFKIKPQRKFCRKAC